MSDTDYQNTVAEILINIGSVRFSFENPFILTSGLKSPVYVDCRKIISFVNERNTILNLAIEYFKNNNKYFFCLVFPGSESKIRSYIGSATDVLYSILDEIKYILWENQS